MATIIWASGSGPDTPATYGTATNWVGGVVPGSNDIASFKNSHHPTIDLSADAIALGWIFSGTTAYTANITAKLTLGNSGIGGKGLSFTNSGTLTLTGTANFGISTTLYTGTTGTLTFNDHSSAGSSVIDTHASAQTRFYAQSTAAQATLANAGVLWFFDQATAGAAQISNTGATEFFTNATAATAHITNTSVLIFNGNSTAANATIQNANNTAQVTFAGNATAGHATLGGNGVFVFNDASTADNAGIDVAGLSFHDTSTAANAGITGSSMDFYDRSTGGTAQVYMAGGIISFIYTNGPNNDHRVSVGTLSGTSRLYLGANELTIGGNNLSANFDGLITDDLPGFFGPGSLVKIGTGTQALRGNIFYSGHTTIQQGTLELDAGLSTGVEVNGGTLTGTGRIEGVVTVAAAGTLDPGSQVGTLTVGGLVMAAGSTLTSDISIVAGLYDRVAVHGTVALQGATLNLQPSQGFDPGNTRTPYTLIDNDGSDSVSGTFAGLSEGQFFTLGARVFSITYRGGDANDVVITSDGVVIEGTTGKDTIDATHAPVGQPLPTALNDIIRGNGGKDKLSGLGGNDTFVGGAGKDIIDGGKGGHDLADYADKGSSVNVHLNGSHVVKVRVHGKAEDSIKNIEDLRGGTARDTLAGDKKANHLFGGGENDVLSGSTGKDILTGDDGKDRFVFDTKLGASNIDTIADFVHGTDKVVLAHAIFAAVGTLDATDFHQTVSGHAATNAKQHLIYDASDGTLWYDADGKKPAHAAVEFAILGTDTHPMTLTWHDFTMA